MILEARVSLHDMKLITISHGLIILITQPVDDVRKNILKKEIGRTEAVKRRNKIREKLASEFEGVTVSHLMT